MRTTDADTITDPSAAGTVGRASPRSSWLCVISHEDARRAGEEGRLRLPASSERRARRMSPGDGVVIYSPRQQNRAGAVVRRFTAVGILGDSAAYRLPQDLHGSWCRDVAFDPVVREASIDELIDRLSFVRAGSGWGVVFRPGFLPIGADDFALIRTAVAGAGGSHHKSCSVQPME